MKIIEELLQKFRQHPNTDMLILRPNLYLYIKKDILDFVKEKGMKVDTKDDMLDCYFTRIPSTLSFYKTFLNDYTPLKISVSKLKRIKDQKVKIYPVNVSGFKNDEVLSEDDVESICQKTDLMNRYLHQGYDLKEVPHCKVWLSGKFLPQWTIKVLEDE